MQTFVQVGDCLAGRLQQQVVALVNVADAPQRLSLRRESPQQDGTLADDARQGSRIIDEHAPIDTRARRGQRRSAILFDHCDQADRSGNLAQLTGQRIQQADTAIMQVNQREVDRLGLEQPRNRV